MKKVLLLLLLLTIILTGCRTIQSNEYRALKDSRLIKDKSKCYRCIPKTAPKKLAPERKEDNEK